MVDVRLARYVLVLVEERHFGRAAERLHIAQSALSIQVKQLERQLGVTLFDRSTRRVEITAAGLHFAALARTLVAAADRVDTEMDLLAQGLLGQVSVGFVGTATYDVLPRLARLVRSALPAVDLQLRGELLSPDLEHGLLEGSYDLALLRPGDEHHAALAVEPLRTERLVAVLPATHARASASAIDLAELADQTFITHPSRGSSSMHHRVLAACERAGFRPSTVLEVGETATLVVFVAAGLGVALVPEPVRVLRLDGVAYVSLAMPELVTLALARRRDSSSEAARRVAALVREAVRATPT